MTQQATTTEELAFSQPFGEQERQILTPEAVEFLSELVTRFTPRRNKLLAARIQQQQEIDDGKLPDFISETASIRNSEWQIRGIPQDLLDRRVEITGPVERKMVINALNANVKVFMADFEDSLAPNWGKVIDGQINLRDAVNGTISYTNEAGKIYQLKPDPAVLVCRVRGLHLPEKHVTWRGEAIPGSLFDFALYFFHNVKNLLAKGSGPYFYLPKTQAWQEAAWWSEVFSYAEDRFSLPRGTIKATLLIETLPAVFQMDEILHALQDHIVGLNCGRWDYIFSYIKTLKNHPDRVLPDRQVVTMDKPFLSAYSRLLIRTCHRRGAFAMGGMAAFIPSKDAERNEWVLNKVRADKELEARNGHDGTWVAHPGLGDTVMEVFNKALGERQNQLNVSREDDAPITAEELLAPCDGERTERSYFTDFATRVPDDCLVLTLACGKYRFNKLDFGDIEGLPRLIDAGQCNDAYSAIILAVTLAEKLGCTVNDLPLSLVLSWFEQKAIVILLTLLSLGVKNITTGPTAPAFLTPDLLAILNEKFGLRAITDVEHDLQMMLNA